MSKIISMSLWGSNTLHTLGAIENAYLAKLYFPDWKLRIYCADDVPADVVSKLIMLGVDVESPGRSVEYSGLFWRYRPAYDDPDCERFIVRDADSRLTPRDAWCVNRWIESKEPAHIIRDCESHGIVILGGTCGFVPSFIPDFEGLIDTFWNEFNPSMSGYALLDRGKLYGSDQFFLEFYIWPLIKEHHIAHDNFFKFTGKELSIELLPEQGGRWQGQHADREPYIGQVCNVNNNVIADLLNIGGQNE